MACTLMSAICQPRFEPAIPLRIRTHAGRHAERDNFQYTAESILAVDDLFNTRPHTLRSILFRTADITLLSRARNARDKAYRPGQN